MAGHSRWANIKHKKAKSDAVRGKKWSKCARAIIVAARNGGGDPDSNLALRYAIDEARFENMPKDTIENAVKKGTGELGAEQYETAMYEGYGPGGVAMMLEILTNNRNRTAPEIRGIFDKHGGNLGGAGCVSYNFKTRGQVFVAKASVDEDTLTGAVLDAGADDVVDDGEVWQVLCEPRDFLPLRSAIEKAGFKIESSGINMIPENTVTVTGKDAKRVLELVEALEEHEDVQKVHANFEIPDDVLAAMEG